MRTNTEYTISERFSSIGSEDTNAKQTQEYYIHGHFFFKQTLRNCVFLCLLCIRVLTSYTRKPLRNCVLCPFSSGFVTRVARLIPHVEKELCALPEHLSSHLVLVGFVLLDLHFVV
jgi:hypothetical protein